MNKLIDELERLYEAVWGENPEHEGNHIDLTRMWNKDIVHHFPTILAALKAADEHRRLLQNARNQIEYLHEKFQETGSGNGVIAQIDHALQSYTAIREDG